MYGTAISLAIMALGSIGFVILLVTQTVRVDHVSPPMETVAFAIAASVVFAGGAGWAVLMARRESRRGRPKADK